MKVAFYHGLESNHKNTKGDLTIEKFDGYAPGLNYRKSGIFEKELAKIKEIKPDLLSGSSIGGYFAYALSTMTGIPTLLLNPAFHGRTFEPDVMFGKKRSKHIVIVGKKDKVVDQTISREWIKTNGIGSFKIHEENIGHRTPIDIYEKWLLEISSKNETITFETFKEYRNK